MENKELKNRIANIVKNEVLTCQTMLVEKLLQSEIVSYDDIVNVYVDNSDKIEEIQNEIDELEDKDKLTEQEELLVDSLNDKISDLESEQEDTQEIMEWWVVTDWMADKLEEQGEPVLRSNYETWWGRTCSGQSIDMDYVIEKIAE